MSKHFVADLSGGMNTRVSPFLSKMKELRLARNVDLEQIGSLRKRSGYSTGVSVQTNKKILGLHEFIITSSGTRYFLAISNNAGDTNAVLKYTQDFSSFTTHGDSDASSLLAGALYEFANFIDLCFIVGYNFTTRDYQSLFTISGIADGTFEYETYTSGAPSAKFIIQSHDRIFLINTENSSNEFFWSDFPTGFPGSWGLSWSEGNSNRVETNDGEELTGVGKNFNRVLLFKPSSIHKWDPDNDELVKEDGRIGSTHHRSIKNIGSSTIFYKEGFGFYDYQQGEPQLISRKIDDWIAAIPQGGDIAADTNERHYLVSVGDITIGNRTYNDVLLDYDYLLNAWTVYENFNASVIARYGQGDTKNFYFGGRADGNVYEMFSYTTTSTSSSTSSTSSTSVSTSSTSSTSTSRSTSSTSSTSRSTSSTSITTT